MILCDNKCKNNTYFSHFHNEERVVNGLNRCDNYFIPHRNHIEIDDIISLRRVNTVPKNTKYIYQIPFRFYRIKSLTIPQTVSLFSLLLNIDNLINDINSGLCMLIFDEHAHSCVLTEDLVTRIDLCLNLIGIKKPVYILTCNSYNNNRHGKMFKTIHWECYEAVAKSLQYKSDIKVQQKEKKRFLCLNLRQRMHRYFLLYKLCQIQKFKENSILSLKPLDFSWLHSQPEYSMFKEHFGKLKNFVPFMKQLPFVTSYDVDKWPCKIRGERGNVYGDTVPEEMFLNSSIFIVTEKEYRYKEDFLTVTEKTFKPISAKMPFIIYGQPNVCKYLQTLGYKTFNTLWDETYDSIYDPILRGEEIVNLVKYLNAMDERDFHDILQKSKDIVMHNYNHMHNRTLSAFFVDAVNGFFNKSYLCTDVS
jgi:hypothetical protein